MCHIDFDQPVPFLEIGIHPLLKTAKNSFPKTTSLLVRRAMRAWIQHFTDSTTAKLGYMCSSRTPPTSRLLPDCGTAKLHYACRAVRQVAQTCRCHSRDRTFLEGPHCFKLRLSTVTMSTSTRWCSLAFWAKRSQREPRRHYVASLMKFTVARLPGDQWQTLMDADLCRVQDRLL